MTILSMTGFGRGAHYPTRGDKTDSINVEVRTVNNKGARYNIRLPDGYASVEPLVYNRLVERFTRGTVDCFITVSGASAASRYVLNARQWVEYRDALEGFKAENDGVAGEVTLELLAGLPGARSEERRVGERV